MANHETPTFHPIARDRVALATISHAVVDAATDLEISALPVDGAELLCLLEASRIAGRRCLIEPQYVSPTTDTTGDFATYRGHRKGHWREIERRGRKLGREYDVDLQLIRRPADLDGEFEEGLRLEASGWKGAAGTAILCSPEMVGFYRAIARSYHERGELRLSQLRAEGRLIAFDLALLSAGRYFLVKTAYDESLRGFSPGLILRRAVIERCFELGLEAHEFLGTDMPWKRLFSTGEREHCVYRGYSRRPLSTGRYSYRRRVRPVIKRAYHFVRGDR
jgi:hypothetical protein